MLKHKKLLGKDEFLTPDLALYEITNSVWKHQYILKDLENGLPYISILYDLVDSGAIKIVSPNEKILFRSYDIAARSKASIYDAIFIALSLETNLELKTFDKQQTEIMLHETKLQ